MVLTAEQERTVKSYFEMQSTYALLVMSLIALPACSLALDFEALTNGAGGAGGAGSAECVDEPCQIWKLSCHSVYVTPDEKYAYVTRFQKTDSGAGLYRLDLSNVAQSGTKPFHNNGSPAVGIAANSDWVIYAAADESNMMGEAGTVFKYSTQGLDVAPLWGSSFGNPFGVALSSAQPAPTVYWADGTGSVWGVDGQGTLLNQWKFMNKRARYVAAHESMIYATAIDTSKSPNQAQVFRLESNGTTTLLIGEDKLSGYNDIQGLAVASLKRAGDSQVVPHIFFVTSVGAGVVWETGDAMEPIKYVALGPQKLFDKPGEIVVDDQYVYWAMRAFEGSTGKGAVYRQALGDLTGTAESVGSNQPAPVGISLAGNSVYWCSSGGLFRRAR